MDSYFKTRLNFDKNRAALWKVIAGFIQKYVPESSVLLDLGAGYCDFVNAINAKEKHALDIFKDLPLYAEKGVVPHVMPASDLSGFSAGKFDVVFASNFFEHLLNGECNAVLKQLHHILKPGGSLIILQPNFKYGYKEYFDDYTHKAIYTHISFCDILENEGFVIAKLFKRLLPFSIKKKLPKSKLLLWLYLRLPIRPFACQMLIIAKKPVVRQTGDGNV